MTNIFASQTSLEREIFLETPVPNPNISRQSPANAPVQRAFRIQSTLLHFDVADINTTEHRETTFGKTYCKLQHLELHVK